MHHKHLQVLFLVAIRLQQTAKGVPSMTEVKTPIRTGGGRIG